MWPDQVSSLGPLALESDALLTMPCSQAMADDEKSLQSMHYRISLAIRQSFFSFQNNPKDLDQSCKTDLDLWDCFGRIKLVL